MSKKKWASGKYAIAICDRSGMKFPYREMVLEPGTGYRVHRSENDGMWSLVNHPQNFPPKDLADAIALRWARPDVILATTAPYLVTDSDEFILTNTGDYIEIT